LGWEPEEFHRFIFDDEGRHVGTVVTREAEWDDRQRERMLALGYYEAGVCECGFHESLTGDKANHFTFDTKTCPVCRGSAKMARIQADADERSDKSLGEHPAPGLSRAGDGRRMFVRRMSPLEVAAKSVPQQSPGK
jgi:hypothetical protein